MARLMIGRFAVWGLLVAAIGCDSSKLDPSGTAGSSGGDAAGTTGIAGSVGGGGSGGSLGPVGGTGGTLPSCSGAAGARDSVELAIAASDGTFLASNVSAAVTVASIDSCASVTCPTSFLEALGGPTLSTAATRIGLTGPDPQRWTLYLRNTNMPADFIKVGDTYDLTVNAHLPAHSFGSTAQTIVLAHGTDLVLFATEANGYGLSADVPDLSAMGIGITSGGASCETPPSGITGCGYRQFDTAVTVAGESVSVGGGKSGRVAWLSFTNGGGSSAFGGFCDAPSYTAMAGYRVP
jgi:hypothetical protein